MNTKEKKVRKFLSKKIHELNDVVADLDTLVTEMGSEYFRVCIFGSARIEPESKEYKKVYRLCLLYTSPSPRDRSLSRMPSSA